MASKFKHIFVKQSTSDAKNYIKLPSTVTNSSNVSNTLKANPAWFAFMPSSSQLCYHKLNEFGTVENSCPVLHSGAQISDFDLSNFMVNNDENLIGLSTTDGNLRVVDLPSKKTISLDLGPFAGGHANRVLFHPTVDNTLCTSLKNGLIILWDLNQQKPAFQAPDPQVKQNLVIHSTLVNSLSFNHDGGILGTTQQKKAQYIDPRSSTLIGQFNACDSIKPLEIHALGNNSPYWITNSFSKLGELMVRSHDIRKICDTPLSEKMISKTSSKTVLIIDPSHSIIYSTTIGERVTKVLQFWIQGNQSIEHVTDVNLSQSTETLAISGLPFFATEPLHCEMLKVLRATPERKIETLSFLAPRKNTHIFHDDLFPPCFTGKPTMDIAEWSTKFASEDSQAAQSFNSAAPILESRKPEGVVSAVEVLKKDGGLKEAEIEKVEILDEKEEEDDEESEESEDKDQDSDQEEVEEEEVEEEEVPILSKENQIKPAKEPPIENDERVIEHGEIEIDVQKIKDFRAHRALRKSKIVASDKLTANMRILHKSADFSSISFSPSPKSPTFEQQYTEKERIQTGETERLEKVRIQEAKLEQERLKQERIEKEKLENTRIEKEKLENARIEKEKLEKERIEKENLEKERIEKEKLENERIEKEKLENERIEKEMMENSKKKASKDEPNDNEEEKEESSSITIDASFVKIHAGYLNKRNPHGIGWKKRYFELISPPNSSELTNFDEKSSPRLFYFKKEHETKSQGDINLFSASKVYPSSNIKKNSFTIETEKRKFVLHADNENDFKKWFGLIEENLNKIKNPPSSQKLTPKVAEAENKNDSIQEQDKPLENNAIPVAPAPIPAILENKSFLCGNLKKKNPSGSIWQTRFFEFDPQFNILDYYVKIDSEGNKGKKKGGIHMNGVTSIIATSIKGLNPKYANRVFAIKTSDRTFYLRAKNEKQRDHWINSLKMIVGDSKPQEIAVKKDIILEENDELCEEIKGSESDSQQKLKPALDLNLGLKMQFSPKRLSPRSPLSPTSTTPNNNAIIQMIYENIERIKTSPRRDSFATSRAPEGPLLPNKNLFEDHEKIDENFPEAGALDAISAPESNSVSQEESNNVSQEESKIPNPKLEIETDSNFDTLEKEKTSNSSEEINGEVDIMDLKGFVMLFNVETSSSVMRFFVFDSRVSSILVFKTKEDFDKYALKDQMEEGNDKPIIEIPIENCTFIGKIDEKDSKILKISENSSKFIPFFVIRHKNKSEIENLYFATENETVLENLIEVLNIYRESFKNQMKILHNVDISDDEDNDENEEDGEKPAATPVTPSADPIIPNQNTSSEEKLQKKEKKPKEKKEKSAKKKKDILTDLGIENENAAITPKTQKFEYIDHSLIKKGLQMIMFEVRFRSNEGLQQNLSVPEKKQSIIDICLVKPSMNSISQSNVYVLDTGKTIFQMNGRYSNKLLRARALEISTNIKYKDYVGAPKHVVLDFDSENFSTEEIMYKGFWELLFKGDEGNEQIQSKFTLEKLFSVEKQEKNNFKMLRIFKITKSMERRKKVILEFEATIENEAVLPSKSLLDSNDVFVVDHESELFLWVGSQSKKPQRDLGLVVTQALYLEKQQKQEKFYCAVFRIVDGGENVIFKEQFSDYERMLPISQLDPENKYSRSKNAKILKTLTWDSIFENSNKQITEKSNSKGSEVLLNGTLTIYSCSSDKKGKKIEISGLFDKGHFHDQNSYLFLYSWFPHMKNFEKYIIFYLQGFAARANERGQASMMVMDLNKEIGKEAEHKLEEQHQESELFLKLLNEKKISYIIHSGYEVQQAETQIQQQIEKKMFFAVFMSRSGMDFSVKCAEIKDISTSHLNSNKCYISLDFEKSQIFIWQGNNSKTIEKEKAKEFAANIVQKILRKPWSEVSSSFGSIKLEEEHKETQEFWNFFNEKTSEDQKYVDYSKYVSFSGQQTHNPRLFEVFISDEEEVTEIFNFSSASIWKKSANSNSPYCYILEATHLLVIWFGKVSSYKTKKLALRLGSELQKLKNNVECFVTYEGQECLEFTSNFPIWYDSNYGKLMNKKLIPGETGAPKTRIRNPLQEVLNAYSKQVFTYDELLVFSDANSNTKLPEGVDRMKLEEYLTDEDFEKVFGIPKKEFDEKSLWKKNELKKKAYLY